MADVIVTSIVDNVHVILLGPIASIVGFFGRNLRLTYIHFSQFGALHHHYQLIKNKLVLILHLFHL